MKAYVVRMKNGVSFSGPRIVGFFVAPNLTELAWMADQVGDVDEMEATEVKRGGVAWMPSSPAAGREVWTAQMDDYSGVPNRAVGLHDPDEDEDEDEDEGEALEWFDLELFDE